MSKFKNIVEAQPNSKFILQGNTAFALGVVHAGYHAADGYPGTPSTEIIDKCLRHVQDKMVVGWSVNEAVSVGVAVGHSISGFDALVTMKMPGVFQAADVITTSAFFHGKSGALVIFAAADYVPLSTQHVIDARYFFASSRISVIEPRNLQEMYEAPKIAADISRNFNTPVVIMASGILNHSEGLVTTGEPRTITPLEAPVDFSPWMLLPISARQNYDNATQKRIPDIQNWLDDSNLVLIEKGTEDWGIISAGKNESLVREVLQIAGKKPSILSFAVTYPIPKEQIKKFASSIKGKLYIIEDGDRFLEEKIRLLGIQLIGKEENSVLTNWDTETISQLLSAHISQEIKIEHIRPDLNALVRPPAICPGCPYKAFTLAVQKLKRQKKIYASFGDIGCSSLTFNTNTIDTILCMGAADSVRQGFALSRPELAHKMISVIGDSSECHSGLDSTRNAIFRNTPGVKIILDNRLTAMTGGQPAPSSPTNLAGMPHKFDLRKAIEAEGGRTVVVNSFGLKEVENALKEALKLAEHGEFTTLILEGACVKAVDSQLTVRAIEFDHDKCTNCGRCEMCPGIDRDALNILKFTDQCTNCGGNEQVCMQRCPHEAIIPINLKEKQKSVLPILIPISKIKEVKLDEKSLPESIRLAIRGVGGQGNLFFGKVLTELALRTPYADKNIFKSDTHGMAQLGGAVISTFSCGNVHTPVLSANSTDVLVAMEQSEVLRPGFLELLKPGGTIILNQFKVLPINTKAEDYPLLEDIEKALSQYKVIKINANEIVEKLGDVNRKTANVAVLGLLSSIEPFNAIPVDNWLSALFSVSPNDFLKSANKKAFEAGRIKEVSEIW